jgi:3-hydroxyisobutyrate dehydrogenase
LRTNELKERIGFVGVGRMGANMARRLAEVGWKIAAVYDVAMDASRALAAELGATSSATLAGVSHQCDLIFTVVSDDDAMESVYFGATDNLLRESAGKLFVNCATITPRLHVRIEQAARDVGASSLEACMASSISQARDGSLYLMCGGEVEVFQRAEPVLRSLSTSLRFVGRAGEAAKVKALVNMVMNSNTVALAEGLGLGAALGLDLKMLREVFSQTGANSRVLETDGEDMQNREHACYFSAAHAAKDSGIALALAKESGLNLPVAAAAKDQFQRMIEEGIGDLDKSGVAELVFPGRRP